MDLHLLAAAGGIALIDIVLSGDNALVIGVAAGRLHRTQRVFAILFGGFAALVLRLLLATAVTEVLNLPYLQFVGGIILTGIAIHLLLPEGENPFIKRENPSMLAAIVTILLADVTMSLDNVIAVGALAKGHVVLLIAGVAFSMLFLFIASGLIASVMERLRWLIDVAAVVLAWTAAGLVLDDPFVQRNIHFNAGEQLAVRLGVIALVLVIDLAVHARDRRRERRAHRAAAVQADSVREAPASPVHEPSSSTTH